MKTSSLGAVTFGVLWPDNSAGWRLGSFMGEERIELLRKARNNEPLPAGVLLVVQTDGGYRLASHDDVDWAEFDHYEAKRG